MADLRTQSRVDFIDFAKAWAILGVALYHYMMPLNSQKWFQLAITFGGTGIHLFFFLSGYGLGLSRPLTPFLFYKRRFVRILAPYFLFVTAVFLLNLWLPIYPSQGWKHYLSHVLLYKMFFLSSTWGALVFICGLCPPWFSFTFCFRSCAAPYPETKAGGGF